MSHSVLCQEQEAIQDDRTQWPPEGGLPGHSHRRMIQDIDVYGQLVTIRPELSVKLQDNTAGPRGWKSWETATSPPHPMLTPGGGQEAG